MERGELIQTKSVVILSATVQAYCALLYSGYYSQEHPLMRKAEYYIRKKGGSTQTHFMTKWMLAANGLYQWPSIFYIPMTFLLIPYSFPLNFFNSVHTREFILF
ncbi:squalene cyclase [Metabacillus crassostreae]|nr:squalene cyclase [Metabacillus crassostreae]